MHLDGICNAHGVKKGLPDTLLAQWESKVPQCIKGKIENLQSNNICPWKNHTSLQNESPEEALKNLRNRCVITFIENIDSNVPLNFKRFYILTLFKELGITNSQFTNTYRQCNYINHNTVLKKPPDDLLRYLGISVSGDNKHLPSIYWLPKLHKNPTKARFIIGSPT